MSLRTVFKIIHIAIMHTFGNTCARINGTSTHFTQVATAVHQNLSLISFMITHTLRAGNSKKHEHGNYLLSFSFFQSSLLCKAQAKAFKRIFPPI